MRARYRDKRVRGLALVAQLVDADVYYDDSVEALVVLTRAGRLIESSDVRIGGLRLSVESQRFYTSMRDAEDLMPGMRFSRADR